MPVSSIIEITYDATPIQTSVIFSTVSFEAQLSAVPGTFEFEVKDPDQVFSFVTGKEVTMSTDGELMFGGYVTQVTRKFAFPVVDTVTPSSDQVKQRIWTLRGVDYNILFDKLVLRNTADYLSQLPTQADTEYDDTLIEYMFANFVDMPAGFDTTTLVGRVAQPIPAVDQPDTPYFAYKQQGTKLRDQMDEFALICGAIYYFNAAKELVYRAVENSEAKWGFADVPNYRVVTASPTSFQGATYGFREVDIVEDGTAIIDDAFVWGGSFFAGTSGGTVFARAQNATAIAKHGRWQASFTKFGEPLYKTQAGVDLLSNLIVSGSLDGLDPANGRGLVYPQFRISLAWFSDDVPTVGGNKDHLRPGDLVTFIMYVLHDADHPQGLVLQLPLRQIKVSVPTTTDGLPYFRFDGIFGLQANDPFTFWRYLLKRQSSLLATVTNTANNTTTSTTYGAFGQFTPTPSPDGSTTVFDLPNGIGYISGTQEVYLNRLFQRPGFEYTASDPVAGEITFASAPAATDSIFLLCRTT